MTDLLRGQGKTILTYRPAPDKKKPGLLARLNVAVQTPIGATIVSLVMTGIVGSSIAYYFSELSAQEKAFSDRSNAAEAARRSVISGFNDAFSMRRATLGLLRSSIYNQADKEEVAERWRLYQQAYLRYNANDVSFQADIVQFLGYGRASEFRYAVDNYITPSFTRMDYCMTQAYRLFRVDKFDEARAVLKNCAGASYSTDSDKPSKAWNFTTEMGKVQVCFKILADDLISATFFQSNFEHQLRGERLREWSDDEHYTYASDGKTPTGCQNVEDWGCQRKFLQLNLKKRLANACGSLQPKYYTPPNYPAPMGPKTAPPMATAPAVVAPKAPPAVAAPAPVAAKPSAAASKTPPAAPKKPPAAEKVAPKPRPTAAKGR